MTDRWSLEALNHGLDDPKGWFRHLRHRDHLAGLPVLENETVQLGAGSPDMRSIVALGRDLIIGRIRIEPRLSAHVVLDPGWLFVMLPLSWKTEFRFNGYAALPNDLLLTSSRDGYATLGEKRDNLGIGVRKDKLSAVLRALSGNFEDDFDLVDQNIDLGEFQARHLRQSFLACFAGSGFRTLSKGRILLHETVETHLISLLALVLSPHVTVCSCASSGRIDPRHVVRRALRAYEIKPPECVTLEDLCRTAGVGRYLLHTCFVDLYGVSPMSYQRARRLRQARAMLLDEDAPPRSVKDVSLAMGFINGGRFASEYAALFGEKPSETFPTGSARWNAERAASAGIR